MQNPSSRTKKSPGVWRDLALSCCALVAVVFAAALVSAADPCKVHKLEVPDPKTLKLGEGENVIASVDTERGKFEARVNVKNKLASEPRYFLGGKLLKETPESKVPKAQRDCLKNAERGASAYEDELKSSGRQAMSWVAPAAYTPARRCDVYVGCDDRGCCAFALCSGQGFIYCELF